MKLFRARARTVEAVCWNGSNALEVKHFLGGLPFPHLGHWVVRKGHSDVLIYSPAEFEAAFEPAFEPLL